MLVELYDPHPGLAGCPIRLPGRLLIMIRQMNGKVVDDQDAADLLQKEAKGLPGIWEIRLSPAHQMLFAEQSFQGCEVINGWRLLRYREPTPTENEA